MARRPRKGAISHAGERNSYQPYASRTAEHVCEAGGHPSLHLSNTKGNRPSTPPNGGADFPAQNVDLQRPRRPDYTGTKKEVTGMCASNRDR